MTQQVPSMGLIFSFGDLDRTVLVYGPVQWIQTLRTRPAGQRKLPAVVMLHDGPFMTGDSFVTPEAFAAHTRMHEVSTGAFTPLGQSVPDEDLFFTIYLGGLDLQVGNTGAGTAFDGRNGWNSGHMFMEALIAGADDAAFVSYAVSLVKTRLQDAMQAVTGLRPHVIDDARRFVVGMGNGGEMVYRLLAQAALFRGAAVVGGTIGGKPVGGFPFTVKHTPTSGVSATVLGLLHIHGSTDSEVRWENPSLSDVNVLVPSVADDARVVAENPAIASIFIGRTDYLPVTAMKEWVTFLPSMPVFVIPGALPVGGLINNGVSVAEWKWQGANSVVKLWRVNMGHAWPKFDAQNTWEGAVQIWDFFKNL